MSPAELLMDVITSGGTPSVDCGFCGRTWFTHEDDEVEALRAKAKTDPDKFCESSDDSLATGRFEGRQIVYGCCEEKLKKYADWLWDNREIVYAYLKKRAKAELEAAQQAMNVVS